MFKIAFTDEQRDYCIRQLEGKNMGMRGRFDGNSLQQLFGLLGQVVTADILGVPRPEVTGQPDGGVDFIINGKTVDLKVVLRNSYAKTDWMVNLPEPQAKYPTEFLLFMNYNKESGVFQYLGFISKKDFLEKAKYHPVGSTIKRDDGTLLEIQGCAMYDLPIKKLRSITEKKHLERVGRYEAIKESA